MQRTKFLALFILCLALLLQACSIEINQPPAPTAVRHTTPFFEPTATQLPPPGSTQAPLPTRQIPVTWSALNLRGRLVYNSARYVGDRLVAGIEALDLASGTITTIFQAPPETWTDHLSVSPDGKRALITYVPPRDQTLPGQQSIFSLPLDGSAQPSPFVKPTSASEQYYHAIWSPDGRAVYYSAGDPSAAPRLPGQQFPNYDIFRMNVADGKTTKIAENAYWPRLSADGSKLAYVTLDPLTGTNKLYVAAADGSQARQVTLSGLNVPQIIDSPLFTADGTTLLYSAVSAAQSSWSPAWWERLLGVMAASAHSVPSDWWAVPVQGGEPQQITHIASVGLYGCLSPDQKYIASYSGGGLFVMQPNGGGLTMLYSDVGGLQGTVNWIP